MERATTLKKKKSASDQKESKLPAKISITVPVQNINDGSQI